MTTALSHELERDASRCPMHAGIASRRTLDAADELVLPMNRRVITQYAQTATGERELRLYYGDKEISFDEPDLFVFGETLGKQSRFVAGAAMTWGPQHEWARVRDLLEQLIEQNVLRHADENAVEERTAGDDGARPSPLPPAMAQSPRTWHDCEQVMLDVTGRSIEVGYLELVVPIFRVAHMAMDAEGRQVGEANVFPPVLRLDVPTRWRTCIYGGSRHQSDRPMNVTALKSMRAHWGQMMAALLHVRAAYLRRFPAARDGWTVGHLERLSMSVLALPTYMLMRTEGRVANGQLHPALSSLFRVTDGVRMTMHQMLFVPVGEPTLSPDAPMTSAEIYAYAERNYSFHSEHGVCAGPQVMIEEFLAVLVDGRMPREGLPATLDPDMRAALAQIEPAIDYALLGLQAYAAVFSLWPLMTRTYETLSVIANAWEIDDPRRVTAFRDRIGPHVGRLKTSAYLATESWRVDREQVYADMYAQCAFGLTGTLPSRPLDALLAFAPTPSSVAAEHALRAVLVRHFQDDGRGAASRLDDVLACLMQFFMRQQSVMRVACDVQRHINGLLGRTPPSRAFTAADMDLHIRLQSQRERLLPYLPDEFEDLFGIRIVLDRDGMQIIDTDTLRRSMPTPQPIRAA